MIGKTGIPQADNDIVSSFLGNLYMVFGDLLIDQELATDSEIVQSHSVTRYCDDIYITIDFHPDCSTNVREDYVGALKHRLADMFYFELALNTNAKSRTYWLNNEKQIEDLLATLKKVSPQYHMSDDKEDEHPVTKVKNLFDELRKLKKSQLDPSTKNEFQDEILRDEILKEVFDPSSSNYWLLSTTKNELAKSFRTSILNS